MPKKKTTEEFIADAHKVHGDKYRYDKVVYVNDRTKVIVTCPVHGDFPITPDAHIVITSESCKKVAILRIIP